ncbi:hypothetical protein [Helicobacter sp. T3_23-1056]
MQNLIARNDCNANSFNNRVFPSLSTRGIKGGGFSVIARFCNFVKNCKIVAIYTLVILSEAKYL